MTNGWIELHRGPELWRREIGTGGSLCSAGTGDLFKTVEQELDQFLSELEAIPQRIVVT